MKNKSEQTLKIIKFFNEGYSCVEIAKTLNIPRLVVYTALRNFCEYSVRKNFTEDDVKTIAEKSSVLSLGKVAKELNINTQMISTLFRKFGYKRQFLSKDEYEKILELRHK